MMSIKINPSQCRAARGLLDWSQAELAKAAHVSRQTVASYETGAGNLQTNNILALQSALESVGIEFIQPAEPSLLGGAGVRFRTQAADLKG